MSINGQLSGTLQIGIKMTVKPKGAGRFYHRGMVII